jgi:hypothetical protein
MAADVFIAFTTIAPASIFVEIKPAPRSAQHRERMPWTSAISR